VLGRSEPVSFTLERHGGGLDWYTDATLVASAVPMNGMWQLSDAAGAHVVTLVPLGEGHDDRAGLALIGPRARLLGSIHPREDAVGREVGSVVSDTDGRAILVLRTDGDNGAHVVDRHGSVIAVASWEDRHAVTDLLVTPLGTRHSLAMVFGLVLTLELDRQSRPKV